MNSERATMMPSMLWPQQKQYTEEMVLEGKNVKGKCKNR